MAFFNKIKAAGSNTANRIGQSFDSAEYDNKISGQKSIRNKTISEAGQLAYQIYLEGKKTFNDEMFDLMEKIEDCDIEIERLEQEKADNIAARKEERRSTMEQAYDADDAVDQQRAERAAERRQRREAEKQAQAEAEAEPEPAPTKAAPKKAAPKKEATKKAAPKKAADKPASKSKKKTE